MAALITELKYVAWMGLIYTSYGFWEVVEKINLRTRSKIPATPYISEQSSTVNLLIQQLGGHLMIAGFLTASNETLSSSIYSKCLEANPQVLLPGRISGKEGHPQG